jgi:hypothetical protein
MRITGHAEAKVLDRFLPSAHQPTKRLGVVAGFDAPHQLIVCGAEQSQHGSGEGMSGQRERGHDRVVGTRDIVGQRSSENSKHKQDQADKQETKRIDPGAEEFLQRCFHVFSIIRVQISTVH